MVGQFGQKARAWRQIDFSFMRFPHGRRCPKAVPRGRFQDNLVSGRLADSRPLEIESVISGFGQRIHAAVATDLRFAQVNHGSKEKANADKILQIEEQQIRGTANHFSTENESAGI